MLRSIRCINIILKVIRFNLVPEAVSKLAKDEDLWSMDYTRLVHVLIKGKQEHQEIIEHLKNEIIDLKNEMKK